MYRVGLALSLGATATILAATGFVAVWQLSQRRSSKSISSQEGRLSSAAASKATSPTLEQIPIGIAWREEQEEAVDSGGTLVRAHKPYNNTCFAVLILMKVCIFEDWGVLYSTSATLPSL